jgi:aminoglycoside/choline kinase family phosphotransferase
VDHVPGRLEQLTRWLGQQLEGRPFELAPASSDASFRRYFRVSTPQGSVIVMDAPPEKEDSAPYVEIARRLGAAGLMVPEVLVSDLKQGFLLISDLGMDLYLDRLTHASKERLYGDALAALRTMQRRVPTDGLPRYSPGMLHFELGLFGEWFLERHLGLRLTKADREVLEQQSTLLVESALEQPVVFVHRDYHSRNLMVVPGRNPGILDFQGAVAGPVTYDLVSLLRDCYIAWPEADVTRWATAYFRGLVADGALADGDEERFLRWFDLMGLQRHLKAIGIFARLKHRDGKPGYLADIPRTLDYVYSAAARQAGLAPLHGLLEGWALRERHGRTLQTARTSTP